MNAPIRLQGLSQTDQIPRDLKKGRRLTPIDALDLYGCFRLGARIWDLKRRGFSIHSERVEVSPGKHVARYRMLRAAS